MIHRNHVHNSTLAAGHNETRPAIWLGRDGNLTYDPSRDGYNHVTPICDLPLHRLRNRALGTNLGPKDALYGMETLRILVIWWKARKCAWHWLLWYVFCTWCTYVLCTTTYPPCVAIYPLGCSLYFWNMKKTVSIYRFANSGSYNVVQDNDSWFNMVKDTLLEATGSLFVLITELPRSVKNPVINVIKRLFKNVMCVYVPR